ncbi:hypothetical protein BVX98_02065 [bacterium F11]|nr:hypothetical protein BVX98_02065 [bacterium F11]
MKKLMAAAIVTLFVSAATSWALVGLEDVSFDGSLEVSGASLKNAADQQDSIHDRAGGVNTRVFVGINAQVTEGVTGRVEFSRTGEQYGHTRGASNDGTNANNVDTELNIISVQNAFIKIADVAFGVGAILGRQYVGKPGDLVWNISPSDNDVLSVAAIDGLTLMRDWENVKSNLFIGKAIEDDTQTGTNIGDAAPGDVNLNSLDLEFPTIVPNGNVNIGYLWGVAENTGISGDANKLTTFRVGINGNIQENRFTYRAEYFQNGGEDKGTNLPGGGVNKVSYGGNAIDLGVGYNSPETEAGLFNVRAGILMASGDDNATDGDDDAFHDFAILTGAMNTGTSDRFMGEIFGKSSVFSSQAAGFPVAGGSAGVETGAQGVGMEVINIGVTYTPPILENKLSAALDYWIFDTSESGDNSAAPKADEIGDEIDLVLTYAQSESVGIDLGLAMFSPGNGVVGTATSPAPEDDDIIKIFTRAKVKWGGEE